MSGSRNQTEAGTAASPSTSRDMSRRDLLKLGASAAAGALLPSTTRAAVGIAAYHGASLTEHQQRIQSYTAAGMRPISISIYGTASAPAFAAVWAVRSGPSWVISSNMTASQFQAFAEQCVANNRRITLLSATGTGADPRFEAVAEASSFGTPLTRHGLRSGLATDSTTIQYWLEWARANGQIPKSIAIYGTASDPRYAMVVEPNPTKIPWNVDGLNETAAEFQARFDAQWNQDGRASLVDVSPAGRYLSLFRGDALVGGEVVRHDMTHSSYQTEFDNWWSQGLYPMQVAAGGSGTGVRIAAVFVSSEALAPRTQRVRGYARSAALDSLMQSVMTQHRVRHATLAVVKGERLVYARAFTDGEAEHPTATPITYFRMASCAKMLTAILLTRLAQDGILLPAQAGQSPFDRTLQSILGLKTPSGGDPPDSRFSQITLGQMLTHRSGLNRASYPPEIAAPFGGRLPVTKSQFASYVASRTLAFSPGQPPAGVDPYSNDAFALLGMVIEKLTGQTYIEALRTRLFTPLGAARVRISPMLPESQPSGEARYDSTRLQLAKSVVTGDNRLLPVVYGADFDPSYWDASGGLSIGPIEFAKVLANLNRRSGNPILRPEWIDVILQNGFGIDQILSPSPAVVLKGGGLWGLTSTVCFAQNGVSDGISYVVAFAKDGVAIPSYFDIARAVEATSWPAGEDLFPLYLS